MLTSFKRSFLLGWKNFKNSGGLSAVAIIVLTATIFLATSLFLAGEVSESTIRDIEESADISIYFKITAPEDQIFEMKEDLREEFDFLESDYVSRHEALESFRERHAGNPVLMEALDEVGNVFSARLDIRAREVENFRAVSDYARSNYSDIIDEIDFYRRKEAIESIFSITSRIERFLMVFGLVLGLVSIFIVFGTIRLSIYSLEEEIKIMKLVGTSNLFIRGSFLAQGLILGVIASLFSLLVLTGLTFVLTQGYNVLGIDLEHHILSNIGFILSLQLITGIVLSILSAEGAVRKYLDF